MIWCVLLKKQKRVYQLIYRINRHHLWILFVMDKKATSSNALHWTSKILKWQVSKVISELFYKAYTVQCVQCEENRAYEVGWCYVGRKINLKKTVCVDCPSQILTLLTASWLKPVFFCRREQSHVPLFLREQRFFLLLLFF